MTKSTQSHLMAQLRPAELASKIVNACGDAKGKDLSVLYVNNLIQITDYFIIATGRSDRHVQGICNRIIQELSENGIEPVGIEGLELGQWVILDFTDVVVHVFYEPIRERYDIESLWASAEKIKPSALNSKRLAAPHAA